MVKYAVVRADHLVMETVIAEQSIEGSNSGWSWLQRLTLGAVLGILGVLALNTFSEGLIEPSRDVCQVIQGEGAVDVYCDTLEPVNSLG